MQLPKFQIKYSNMGQYKVIIQNLFGMSQNNKSDYFFFIDEIIIYINLINRKYVNNYIHK